MNRRPSGMSSYEFEEVADDEAAALGLRELDADGNSPLNKPQRNAQRDAQSGQTGRGSGNQPKIQNRRDDPNSNSKLKLKFEIGNLKLNKLSNCNCH
jgi:hypothetical protein